VNSCDLGLKIGFWRFNPPLTWNVDRSVGWVCVGRLTTSVVTLKKRTSDILFCTAPGQDSCINWWCCDGLEAGPGFYIIKFLLLTKENRKGSSTFQRSHTHPWNFLLTYLVHYQCNLAINNSKFRDSSKIRITNFSTCTWNWQLIHTIMAPILGLNLCPNPVLSPRPEEAPNDIHLHHTHGNNHCASQEWPPEDTPIVAVYCVTMSGLTGTKETLSADYFVKFNGQWIQFHLNKNIKQWKSHDACTVARF